MVVPQDILRSMFSFFLVFRKQTFFLPLKCDVICNKRLVWKGSFKVGHGVAFSNQKIASGSGSFYRVTLVADYQAAGNMNCPSGCIQNVQAP